MICRKICHGLFLLMLVQQYGVAYYLHHGLYHGLFPLQMWVVYLWIL